MSFIRRILHTLLEKRTSAANQYGQSIDSLAYGDLLYLASVPPLKSVQPSLPLLLFLATFPSQSDLPSRRRRRNQSLPSFAVNSVFSFILHLEHLQTQAGFLCRAEAVEVAKDILVPMNIVEHSSGFKPSGNRGEEGRKVR